MKTRERSSRLRAVAGRTKRTLAVLAAAALTGGVVAVAQSVTVGGLDLTTTASVQAETTAKTYKTTDWINGYRISQWPAKNQATYHNAPGWSAQELPGVVEPSVQIIPSDETVDPENPNLRLQNWKIIWNSGPVPGISSYGGGLWMGDGYGRDPYFSYTISSDLSIRGKVKYTNTSKDGKHTTSATVDPWLTGGPKVLTNDGSEELNYFYSTGAQQCLQHYALSGPCGNVLEYDYQKGAQSWKDQSGVIRSGDRVPESTLFNDKNKAQSFLYDTFKDAGYQVGDFTMRKAITTAEFTTVRDVTNIEPAIGSPTMVVAGFKNFDESTFVNRIHYVLIPNDTDTDGDGLKDAYENYIGSNPNVVDTDGDGVNDRAEIVAGEEKPEVRSKYWSHAKKIGGTDPTVGIQARPYTNKLGDLVKDDQIKGVASPLKTIVIKDKNNQYVGATKSDENGNYTIKVGYELKDCEENLNKYGNQQCLVDGDFVLEPITGTTSWKPDELTIEVWSDGWDSRPLFSAPTSVKFANVGLSGKNSEVTPPTAEKPSTATGAYTDNNTVRVAVTLRDDSPNKVAMSGAASYLTMEKVSGEGTPTYLTRDEDGTYTETTNPKFVEDIAHPGTYYTYVGSTTPDTYEFKVSANAAPNGWDSNGNDKPSAAGITVLAGEGSDPTRAALKYTFTEDPTGPTSVTDWNAAYTGPLTAGTPIPETAAAFVVKDKTGNPVPAGTKVWVEIPGSTNRVERTVEADGKVTLPAINVPEVTAADPYLHLKVYGSETATTPLSGGTKDIPVNNPPKPLKAATITPTSDTVVAGKEITDTTISVTLTDDKPAAKRDVWVELPGVEGRQKVTLGEDGTATLPAYTPSAANGSTITVYADDKSDTPLATKTLTLTAGLPELAEDKTHIKLIRDNRVANRIDLNTAKLWLIDAQGNAITGKKDWIDVFDNDGSDVVASIKETGTDGEYTIDFGSYVAGKHSLTIQYSDPSDKQGAALATISDNFEIHFVPGPVATGNSKVEVVNNNAAANSDERNTIKVTLADEYDNAITGKSGDISLKTTPDGWTVEKVEEDKDHPGTYVMTIAGAKGGTASATVMAGSTEVGSAELTFGNAAADPKQSAVTTTCTDAVANGTDTCTVTVTLNDTKGQPLTDDRSGSLSLGITGAATGQPAPAENWTFDSSTGTYTKQVTSTKAGEFPVTVTLNGVTIAPEANPAPALEFTPGSPANLIDTTGNQGTMPAGTEVAEGTITSTVVDAQGNPVDEGTELQVQLPGGVTKTVTVGKDGKISIPAFTPTDASTTNQIVVKTSDGQTTVGTIPVTVTPGAVSETNSEYSIVSDQPVKVTADPAHTLKVVLKDANGNVIKDPEVAQALAIDSSCQKNSEAKATIGALSFSEATEAWTAPVSATVPCDYQVTVAGVGAGANTIARFVAGDPMLNEGRTPHSTFSVSSGSKKVHDEVHTVTVRLVDSKGNAVPDAADKLAVAGSADSGIKTVSGFTQKEDGSYEATVTTDKAGTWPLTVTFDGKNVAGEGTTSAQFEAGTPNAAHTHVKVEPGTTGVALGENQTITVTVADAYGNPVNVKPEDIKLSAAGIEGVTPSAVSGADGTYTATVTSQDKAGDVTITATAAGVTATVAKEGDNVATFLAGEATTATLATQPALSEKNPATAGDTVTFVYTPLDAKGNVATLPDGQKVQVTIPGVNDGKPVELTKQSNGTYTAQVQLTKAGTTTATATSGSLPDATAPVVVKAGPAVARHSLVEVTTDKASYGSTSPVRASDTNVVTVTLRDAYDNPTTSDVAPTVALTNPTNGLTPSLGEATQAQPGVYTFPITGTRENFDEASAAVTATASLNREQIGDPKTVTFLSPPISYEDSRTNFTVAPTEGVEDPILADGVDSYTVTVKLWSEDKQPSAGYVTGREDAIAITGPEGVTISDVKEEGTTGTYTATITSKTPVEAGKIQVTVGGHAVTADGKDTVTFKANVPDATKSTLTVWDPKNPGEEVSSATVGDEVVLTYTPLNAKGRPVATTGPVTVDVPQGDGTTKAVTLSGPNEKGMFTSAPVALTKVGPNTLTVTDADKAGPSAQVKVATSGYDPASSQLSIAPTEITAGEQLTFTYVPKDKGGNAVRPEAEGAPKDTVDVVVTVPTSDGKTETQTVTLKWSEEKKAYVSDPQRYTVSGTVSAVTEDYQEGTEATATVKPGPAKNVDWSSFGTSATQQAGDKIAASSIRVTDEFGNPVAKETPLWVTLPGATTPTRVVVGENGVVPVEAFTMPTKPGPYETTLAEDAEGKKVLSSKRSEVTAGEVSANTSTSSIDPAGKPVVADGGQKYTVTVDLKDASGNAVTLLGADADKLSLTADEATATALGLSTVTFSAVKDAPGRYTATVSSEKALESTLQVSFGSTKIGAPLPVNFVAGAAQLDPQEDPGAPVSTVTTDGETHTADGEDEATVTVTLVDAKGNPVTGQEGKLALVDVTEGEKNPTLSLGGFEEDKDHPGTYRAKVSTTTAKDVTLQAQLEGKPIVTADDHQAKTFTVDFEAGPASKAALLNVPTAVDAGDELTGSVKLTDKSGNPVAGPAFVRIVENGQDPKVVEVTLTDGVGSLPDGVTISDSATVEVYADKDAASAGTSPLASQNVRIKSATPSNAVAVVPADKSQPVPVTAESDAEDGTPFTIYDKAGNKVTEGTVKDGAITADLPAGTDPTGFTVSTGKDAEESPKVPVTVKQQLAAPTDVKAVVDGQTAVVTAKAPAGVAEGTPVTVYDKDGKEITTGTVGPNGEIRVELTADQAQKLTDGEKGVQVSVGSAPVTSPKSAGTVVTRLPKPEITSAVTDPEPSIAGGTTTIKGTVDAAPGTVVTLKDASGNPVLDETGKPVTSTVDDKGEFTFDVPSKSLIGQAQPTNPELGFQVTAGSGDAESEPAEGKTQGRTATPQDISGVVEQDGSVTVSGSVPGAGDKTPVTVMDDQGTVVGTGETNDKGEFTVTLDKPVDPNVTVKVVAGTDPVTSKEGTGTTTLRPNSPTNVVPVLNPDTGVLTVTGEVKDAPNGTPVTVTLPNGETVTGEVKDGEFTITVPKDKQPDGGADSVDVTAGKEPAVSEKVTVPVTVAPHKPVEGEVVVHTDGSVEVTVKVDPGTKPGTPVYVVDPDTGDLVKVGETEEGKDTVTGTLTGDDATKISDDSAVSVVVGDKPAQSEPLSDIEVKKQTATPNPVTAESTADGTTVSGAVPGATKGTPVTVFDQNNRVIGTGTTDDKGEFNFPLDTRVEPGVSVKVTAGRGDTESKPATAEVSEFIPVPQAPKAADVIRSADKTSVKISVTVAPGTKPGTPVYVIDPGTGTAIKVGVVAEGKETVEATLSEADAAALEHTPVVNVVAGDAPKASAPLVGVPVRDQVATPNPVSATSTADSTTVSGVVPGAGKGTKVTVTDKDGKILGTGYTDEKGNFSLTLDDRVAPEETVVVVAGEGALKSEPAVVRVHAQEADPTTTTAPSVPSGPAAKSPATSAVADPYNVFVTPGDHGATVTGTTSPGATVVVELPNGAVFTGQADEHGNFVVTVNGAKAGDILKIHAVKDGAESATVTVKVPGTGLKGVLAQTGASGKAFLLLAVMLISGGLVFLVGVRKRRSER